MFGDGSALGLNVSYKIQLQPNGLAEAFIIGEDFIGQDSVALVLGDNIYYGAGLSVMLQKAAAKETGATIFGYQVNDPERFGVVEFDENNKAISIVEKPEKPKSNYAVTGLYFYDNDVVEIAKNVEVMGRGFAWLDTGTHDSLLEASSFVATIQKQQNLKVASLEEIAYRMGYIDLLHLEALAQPLKKMSMVNTYCVW